MMKPVIRCAAIVGAFAGLSPAPSATAQTVDSGSDESDGALALTTPGVIELDPTSFNPPLDVDGDNVFHFTTINVAAGVTVRLSAEHFGSRPVVWLATGTVQIDGTIDLDGQDGHDRVIMPRRAVAGAGGWNGGTGGRNGIPALAGSGLGGGSPDGNNGGGASHATSATGQLPAYGNHFVTPLLGGSGGGGGRGGSPGSGAPYEGGGGGGAGGGAILIASNTAIVLAGAVRADGGAGASGRNCSRIGWCFGGGGGSGGGIRLVAPRIEGAGTLTAIGGSSFSGSWGSEGRVRLEAFELEFRGPNTPAARGAAPSPIMPPADAPSIRVTSIAGESVAASPLASYVMPDVTFDATGPVEVEVEASNIPLGTRVQLRVTPQTGDELLAESTLSGTVSTSTATIMVSPPSGLSTYSVHADWR